MMYKFEERLDVNRLDFESLPATSKKIMFNHYDKEINSPYSFDNRFSSSGTQLTPITTSTLDGSAAFFTNWGDEFQHAENTSAAGSYAYIDRRNLSQGQFADVNFWNNNKSDSDLANAVCLFKIPRQYFVIFPVLSFA